MSKPEMTRRQLLRLSTAAAVGAGIGLSSAANAEQSSSPHATAAGANL